MMALVCMGVWFNLHLAIQRLGKFDDLISIQIAVVSYRAPTAKFDLEAE